MTIKVLPTAKAEADQDVQEALDYITGMIKENGAEAIVIGVIYPNREASISYSCGDRWMECVGLLDVMKQKVLE